MLIHAGDFTHFGKLPDAEDFNKFLGELDHPHKIVVNGNHENNAPWKDSARKILSNATFLCDESVALNVNGKKIQIFGTNFFWPMKSKNPHYAAIDNHTDIIVAHGPCKDYVDQGIGCAELLRHVHRTQPRLVVSGHIHSAHGMAKGAVIIVAVCCVLSRQLTAEGLLILILQLHPQVGLRVQVRFL